MDMRIDMCIDMHIDTHTIMPGARRACARARMRVCVCVRARMHGSRARLGAIACSKPQLGVAEGNGI